jgi:hypothetical protein
MAAGILALPLAFLAHDTTTGAVTWIGPPARGSRILLVDDCCSSGTTLQRARAAICAEGRQCLTLVVVHDPDVVQHVPDLSFPMRDLFRLPWERGEATPTGRAAKASGIRSEQNAEAPFFGLGLDDALLTCISAKRPLPPLPADRGVIINTLAGTERERIVTLLKQTRYRDLPLECRPVAENRPRSLWKAEAATRWGCTHFIECDAAQAIEISGHAPHLIVSWWSFDAERSWIVGAAAEKSQDRDQSPL